MAAAGERGKWIWIGIGIVSFLAVLALFVLPYFSTRPLSRDQLRKYLPPPATGAPSPAPSPAV